MRGSLHGDLRGGGGKPNMKLLFLRGIFFFSCADAYLFLSHLSIRWRLEG